MDSLQRLVDDLAARLQRSVAVDDPELSLLASSRHFGDEDEVRISSLVGRRPSEGAVRHALAHGLRGAVEPRRISAAPELGLKARVCLPLRSDGHLVAFLWLIDDGGLTDDVVATAVAAGQGVAALLGRARLADEQATARQQEWVRGLLEGDVAARRHAAHDAAAAGALEASARVVVVVSAPREPAAGDDAAAVTLHRAVRSQSTVFRGEPGTGQVTGRVGDAVATVCSVGEGARPADVERVATRLAQQLRSRDDTGQWPAWVTGAGAPSATVEEAWQSYEQARQAVRAARRSGVELAAWQLLTGAQTLAALGPVDLPPHLVPELATSVRSLLDADLQHTLRRYLDLAGDAAALAAELHLHRSTVYHRLGRVERVLGVGLDDGVTRTALHTCLILGEPTAP